MVDAQPGQIDQNATINARDWGAKFRSKKEVYSFLCISVGAYLPPMQNITSYHMRDLIGGEKKVIQDSEVQHLSVPYYENLSVEDLLQFAEQYPEVEDYFPVKKEVKKWPRQYLINCLRVIIGDDLLAFVDQRIKQRNEEMLTKSNLLINVNPQCQKAFLSSNHTSKHNGSGFNLLKIGVKRRRSKAQIQADKQAEQEKLRAIQQNLAKIADYDSQRQDLEELRQQNEQNSQVIQNLIESGVLYQKDDGSLATRFQN